MLQNNPLLVQLKQKIREQLPKKEGVIRASERGFGFLEIDAQTRFFIPPAYMKKVIHGDRVCAVIRVEQDREVAEPETLIQPFLQRFIGRVHRAKNHILIQPDHPSIKGAYRLKGIDGLKVNTLKEGDWVVGLLHEHALTHQQFLVHVSARVASADDPLAPWKVILARHDLAHEDLPLSPIDEVNGPGREDWTHLPFVTIDSTSTKDMDDALFLQPAAHGWQLTVAVADPTAYIAVESALEQSAKARGFTLYLPNYNIPMIPRNLSDDLCSLWAEQKRPALCCRMNISTDGILDEESASFHLAWIQSQAKLSYTQVSDWLETQTGQVPQHLQEMLSELAKMASARLKWRQANQVVFTDRPDFSFELNDQGVVVDLHCEKRRIANRIVEESMIAANVCGGQFLATKVQHGLFNTQSGIEAEHLPTVKALLAEHLPEFAQQDLTELTVFAALQRQLQSPDFIWLNHRLRRMQSFSTLSTEAKPHFAMGLACYATWTSPIRKYSDMVNHRYLKAYLLKAGEYQSIQDKDLLTHLGNCRRMHRAAEREINEWLYQQYLQPFVKNQQVFRAQVMDVTRGGLRVLLVENGASAFLPFKSLKVDRDRLDAQIESGIFNIDGERFARLGDVLPVTIAQLNPETRSVIVHYQGEITTSS